MLSCNKIFISNFQWLQLKQDHPKLNSFLNGALLRIKEKKLNLNLHWRYGSLWLLQEESVFWITFLRKKNEQSRVFSVNMAATDGIFCIQVWLESHRVDRVPRGPFAESAGQEARQPNGPLWRGRPDPRGVLRADQWKPPLTFKDPQGQRR